MEEKHENFIAAVTKSQMRNAVKKIDNFSTKKCVTRKFHVLFVQNGIAVVQNHDKKCTQKCAYKYLVNESFAFSPG